MRRRHLGLNLRCLAACFVQCVLGRPRFLGFRLLLVVAVFRAARDLPWKGMQGSFTWVWGSEGAGDAGGPTDMEHRSDAHADGAIAGELRRGT